MHVELDVRRGSWTRLALTVIAAALLIYLGFAALHGQHGLIRLFQAEASEAQLSETLATLRAERDTLAAKIALLSAPAPDLDLLDERARRVLGLGRPDEMLIP